MTHCKHCNDTLFTEAYDTCMTCFEKHHAENSILDRILVELPVSNVTSHTYENIPERVAYYVKESAELGEIVEKLYDEKTKAVNDYLLLQVYAEEDAETLQSLEKAIKTHYDYYKGFAAKKHLSSIQMLDALFSLCVADSKQNESLVDDNSKDESGSKKFQSVAQLLNYLHPEIASNQAEECARYKAALEEIVKRPRRSETCRLIAQQALGVLNDDHHQPELLMEENLRLKIRIEDLQAMIDNELLNKMQKL